MADVPATVPFVSTPETATERMLGMLWDKIQELQNSVWQLRKDVSSLEEKLLTRVPEPSAPELLDEFGLPCACEQTQTQLTSQDFAPP